MQIWEVSSTKVVKEVTFNKNYLNIQSEITNHISKIVYKHDIK